jgi:hypothetical protein
VRTFGTNRDGTVPPPEGERVESWITDTMSWPCPLCGDSREFVQPPCLDGHTDDGGECPEWACVDCGTALVVGVVPGAAPAQHRRAA